MKKYFKIILPIVVGLIVVFIVVWRLWSHSFDDVISVKESTVTGITCSVSVAGAKESGTPSVDSYQLQGLDKEDEEFDEVLDVLKNTKYRQGFRNLLPWFKTEDTSESKNSVLVYLVWGDSESDNCSLTFLENGKVLVDSGSSDGLKVYYTIDDSVSDKLIAYVQEHGTKN